MSFDVEPVDRWRRGGPPGEELQAVDRAVQGSLAELCRAFVRRNAAQPEIVRLFAVLQAESLDPQHPAHEWFSSRYQLLLRRVESAVIGAEDPVGLARTLVALMDGLQLTWLRFPDEVDLVKVWDRASAAVLRHADGAAPHIRERSEPPAGT